MDKLDVWSLSVENEALLTCNEAPVNDFGSTVPGPRNTAASKVGNGIISLLWRLQRHCNLDHNKFSSLSDTTVVAIFPNLCLWRRSLCSNLGGIDPEKLHRATLTLNLRCWLIVIKRSEMHFITQCYEVRICLFRYVSSSVYKALFNRLNSDKFDIFSSNFSASQLL